MTDKSILSEPVVAKFLALVAAHVAAFAGAVLSLAFVGQLSVRGRVVAVTVGFVTAVFGAPLISSTVNHMIWGGAMPDEVRSGIMFFVSLTAMTILPSLLKWLQKASSDPLGVFAALLPRGPVTPPNGGEGGDA